MADMGKDDRSVTLQQGLVAQWKREIKRRPAAERETWLRSPEAIAALGARQCEGRRRAIAAEYGKLSQLVCSGEWLEAWYARGHKLPIHTPDKGRRYSVRLMLSRGLLRMGEEGVPHRRWTPPQAVDIEDMLDCMGNLEAKFYTHPPSPSAVAMHRMMYYSTAGLRRLRRHGDSAPAREE
jgi:hypothetical protein